MKKLTILVGDETESVNILEKIYRVKEKMNLSSISSAIATAILFLDLNINQIDEGFEIQAVKTEGSLTTIQKIPIPYPPKDK